MDELLISNASYKTQSISIIWYYSSSRKMVGLFVNISEWENRKSLKRSHPNKTANLHYQPATLLNTAQKNKFSIMDFFSKCDQIRNFK